MVETVVDLARGLENVQILFQNDVDDERTPDCWTYISSNIPGPGSDHETFETGYGNCDCADECNVKTCACAGFYHEKLILDEYLNGNSNMKPIIECGLNCECKSELCSNRVVQKGIQVNLCVFKTNNERGFGVKTMEFIQKGAFVCEYAGEIIGKLEAQERFSTQTEQDSNYIHVLKEHFNEVIETIIDPTYFGNVGRFINHSCDPNLIAIPVRAINSVPRLCFFANKNIAALHELTYNYGGDSNCEIGSKICKCGAKNCKKYLPFDKNV